MNENWKATYDQWKTDYPSITAEEERKMEERERGAKDVRDSIWVVLADDGSPEYVAGWPEACHEHINEAIAEGDIDGAEKWVVREYVPDTVCQENATLVLEAKEEHEILRERISDLEALVKALRERLATAETR
jgi:hypothetical protein